MERMKKIGVLALMCALFIGLMPMRAVRASEVEDVELPALFRVTGVGIIYEYYNTDSKMLCALNKGRTGYAYEKKNRKDGSEWYRVTVEIQGEEFDGYIPKSEVELIMLPTILPEPTPVPTDGFEGVVDSIKGFGKMIGAIPIAITAFFGFLPPWCLTLTGVAFALLVALMVIKIVRG